MVMKNKYFIIIFASKLLSYPIVLTASHLAIVKIWFIRINRDDLDFLLKYFLAIYAEIKVNCLVTRPKQVFKMEKTNISAVVISGNSYNLRTCDLTNIFSCFFELIPVAVRGKISRNHH